MDSSPETETVVPAVAGEVLMAALFEVAGAGVYAVNAAGPVIACNPSAEQLLSYSPVTLISVDAHRVRSSTTSHWARGPAATGPYC